MKVAAVEFSKVAENKHQSNEFAAKTCAMKKLKVGLFLLISQD